MIPPSLRWCVKMGRHTDQLKMTWSEMLIKVRGDGVRTRDSVRWKQLSASARVSRIPSGAQGACRCRSVILSLMKYTQH